MQELEQLSDEQLIARATDAGVRSICVACLYKRHLHRVIGWCLRISGDEQEALDIAQEVFIRVDGTLESFRHDSRFTTWLYIIARRTAIDHLRRRQSNYDKTQAMGREPIDELASPEKLTHEAQLASQLHADVKRLLAPDEAQVVYMHFSLGMTLPAITQSLGLTNNSGAKAPLVAAMRKLRRHYKVASGATRSTL